MEELTKHYLISGRVQGVGFRAFTHHTALALRLRGWVRNLEGGRVEVLARGPAEVLAQFEERLRSGPPAGRVDGLQAAVWTGRVEPEAFEIRKDGREPCSESQSPA